jgi:lathosterol oxidase
MCTYLFPIYKPLYLALFVGVQLWTILIHDASLVQDSILEKWWVNSPGHHTLHHLLFRDNLGQYFVWCDKIFGTHREPEPHLDPIHDAIKAMQAKGLADADGNVIAQPKQKVL